MTGISLKSLFLMNSENSSGRGVLLYNVAAVAAGLVISFSFLLFLRLNPLSIAGKTLAKIFSDKYNVGEIFVKATPLIFTSLAFAFTYKASLFNIGAQGQFYMGSIVTVSVSLLLGGRIPGFFLIPLALALSMLSGGVVGGLIGLAKEKRNSNEFLVSMMSTYVVNALMDYLLRTVLQETKAEYMQTNPISPEAFLPIIVPGTRVHLGFLMACLAAIAVHVILTRTVFGFRIRATGMNRNAAELGGINTGFITVMTFAIAGALAAAASVTEINGVQHMLLRNFNSSIGSYGIGIAILANANPIGCIFASLLFGFLNVIGITMGRLPGVSIPSSLVELIEGVVMICVIVSYAVRVWTSDRSGRRKLGGEA